MTSEQSGKPYLTVNRALNKTPTLWIFPIGMVYAIGAGFFFSFVFFILLFKSPLWLVLLFWVWVSIAYYAVVGEKPWKFLHRIRRAPQWRRGNRPLKPLLRDVQTTDRRPYQTRR